MSNNIIFLDIETQHLITEFENGWNNKHNYKKVKIAELGILHNNEYITYEENNINDSLFKFVEADLIVGFNTLSFDYEVLKHYFPQHIMNEIIKKSFDVMIEFDKFTGDAGWCSLDDLAQRNFGMKKTHDSIKIPEMWRNGKIKEVKEYLLNDLKMLEKLYNYCKIGNYVKYDHKFYGKSQGERKVWVKW